MTNRLSPFVHNHYRHVRQVWPSVGTTPIVTLLLLTATLTWHTAAAQPTNAEVMGRLAVACLGDAPDTLTVFKLDAHEIAPYLRSALHDHWVTTGRRVYLADSTRPDASSPNMSVLRYRIEDAGVTYQAVTRKNFRRSIWLAVQYDISTGGGLLLADDRCRHVYEDQLANSILDVIQPDSYPETRSELTRMPGRSRFVKPVVLGTAMATVVYLLFTVRS